jgi:hypothetical protein
MVNDMYELNLLSLQWTKISGTSTDEPENVKASSSSSALAEQALPQARYFHSCNLWNHKLVIFGGMGYVDGSDTDLGVLDEVVVFDLSTKTWDLNFTAATTTSAQASLMPQARYAHLSSATADALVIIGGQDMSNRYVEEINVFDLQSRRWTTRQAYDKQRGSYRSLAVEPLGMVEECNPMSDSESETSSKDINTSDASQDRPHPLLSATNICMLPVSSNPIEANGKAKPSPIYVYTNYNFTDVRREMEVIRLPSGSQHQSSVDIEDTSDSMTGSSLPPGLRFPTGAVLGVHLLISGTYLANTSQTFALWALHLPTMTWTRLDVGPLLSTGSWNRGILWHSQNRKIIFGHRDRELVADYNHRQTNWNHVLTIELEAWGITQPPKKEVSLPSIRLGLEKLASSTIGSYSAALASGLGKIDDETGDPLLCFGGRGDFEIICSDGMRLGCDRIILERRWPWFASKMREYQRKATSLTKNGTATKRSSRPSTGEQLSALLEVDERSGQKARLSAALFSANVDPRITPRQLHMTEPSPVVLALLIFFYTRCICTQLQRHPAVVAALLIVSKVYEMKDLEIWTKHAAHVVMSVDLAPPSVTTTSNTSLPATSTTVRPSNVSNSGNLPILERHRLAVALYEAATMSGFEALQIRALRTVMSIAKYVQRSNTNASKMNGTAGDINSGDSSMMAPQVSPLNGVGRANDRQNSFSGSLLSPAVVSPSYPSPTMYRNDSMHGRLSAATEESSAGGSGVRRSSRASILAGYGDGSGGETSFAPLSRSSTHSLQSNGANQQRRPSAPLLSTSNSNDGMLASGSARAGSLSGPPPASTTTGRKRFSIFGRSNNDHSAKPTKPASTTSIAEGDGQAKSSAEHAATPSSRLQRTNTQGSTGGASSAARSTSSLNATTTGSHALGSPNESISNSTSSLPRLNEFGVGSKTSETTGSNSGRKMSTTLSRLKAAGRPSTAQMNAANEEAIANATVGPSQRMSHSNSDTGSVPHSPGQHSPKGKRSAGQLDKKNVVALNGIFA